MTISSYVLFDQKETKAESNMEIHSKWASTVVLFAAGTARRLVNERAARVLRSHSVATHIY
jgi:hypothetical protein